MKYQARGATKVPNKMELSMTNVPTRRLSKRHLRKKGKDTQKEANHGNYNQSSWLTKRPRPTTKKTMKITTFQIMKQGIQVMNHTSW